VILFLACDSRLLMQGLQHVLDRLRREPVRKLLLEHVTEHSEQTLWRVHDWRDGMISACILGVSLQCLLNHAECVINVETGLLALWSLRRLGGRRLGGRRLGGRRLGGRRLGGLRRLGRRRLGHTWLEDRLLRRSSFDRHLALRLLEFAVELPHKRNVLRK